METSEVNLRLSPDLRERTDAEIRRRVLAAAQHNKGRDDILRDYSDQSEGMLDNVNDGPWANSCQLEDPMTDEHCTMLTAYLMSSVRTEPLCLIEAVNPGDEDAAAQLEIALNAKGQQWKIPEKLYDVIFNAVRFPYSPCAINWKQELGKKRSMATVDVTTGKPVDTNLQQVASQPTAIDEVEGTEPDVQEPETEEVPQIDWEIVAQGPEIRAITPDNFYLYPPTCQDIDKAQLVVERVYFTAEELALGVNKYGYDPDEIEELLLAGGTHAIGRDSIDGNANAVDGQMEDYEDALYECFIVTGRLPLLIEEGKIGVPDYLLDEDFVWIICPDRHSVFKFGPCPYTVRPYTVFHISRKPNRLMGRCVPGYLETLQAEATANIRFKIDILNLLADPVFKVANTNQSLDGITFAPGNKIRVQNMNELEMLPVDFNGFEALTQQQSELLMRADKLMSAPGADQVEQRPQPLTATQAGMIGNSLALKRDLFLQTFLESGAARMWQLIVAIWLQHLPEDGETVVAPGAAEGIDVDTDSLSKRFKYLPHANTDSTNPQARIQMTIAKKQQQMEYFASLLQLPPDKWPQLYHGTRRFFQDTGERNVEAWIGKEPSGGVPPEMMLQAVLPIVQQGAAAGDPVALAILQAVQQLEMQAQGGQPGMMPQGQAQPQQAMPYNQIGAEPAMNGVGH